MHALLDIERWADILGHPVAGPSWEGFVVDNLIAAAGDRRTPYFYRTEDGPEIDLLFERGGNVEMVIEIKRSSAPTVSKGFHIARETLQPARSFVVHAGDDTWPMGAGVAAISLVSLMQLLAE